MKPKSWRYQGFSVPGGRQLASQQMLLKPWICAPSVLWGEQEAEDRREEGSEWKRKQRR